MWLPAMLALPWALPAWWRRLRRRDARCLLPLARWALVPVLFSIPDGTLDVYVMPALAMSCLALAPLLSGVRRRRGAQRLPMAVSALVALRPGIARRRGAQRLALAFTARLAVLMLGAGVAMLVGEPGFEPRLVLDRAMDVAEVVAGASMLVAIGSWGLGCLLWSGRRRAVAGMLAMLAGLWVVFGLVGYRLLTDSSSSAALMRDAGARIGPDAELGLVAWREQNLLMADRTAAT